MCTIGPLYFLLVIPLFSFSTFLNSTYICYALHGKSISGKRNESLQIQHLTVRHCNVWWQHPRKNNWVLKGRVINYYTFCILLPYHIKHSLFKWYMIPQEVRWNRLGCRHPAHRVESYVEVRTLSRQFDTERNTHHKACFKFHQVRSQAFCLGF